MQIIMVLCEARIEVWKRLIIIGTNSGSGKFSAINFQAEL